MSKNPHQEVFDQFDARRHGGGMGVWLGIWTWCWIGSLALGFLIGASIIDQHPPAWGFYLSIVLIAVVLLLNVVCPEARRSSFRRSVAEVRTGSDISRRLARGEVMMHRVKTGPKWWGNEVWHRVLLSLEMLRQPGFSVMAVYVAWIYAQVVLVIILLGSLASRFYHLRSPYVGLHVTAMALGALLAIPFQKASIFSRSPEMERLTQARRKSTQRRASMPNDLRALMEEDIAWRPVMIGNPVGKNRRVNLLELGCMTRWQDIRRKNKLIDESAHLNRSALDQGLEALDAALEDHMEDLRRAQGLFSKGNGKNKQPSRLRRSDQRSDQSSGQTLDVELDTLDLGIKSSGPSHQRQFGEVECFMGQTVKEENEETQAGPSSHRKD
ncbi:hypothetical protein G7Z17_g9197 [Cylindrodendrum hubeiense]|uniref:Uncharacterized protein n=1 Tax=Cylindrodendrum hubeiense TaxID=595255 RepID=A0A9P5LDK7_9HYPO|nr:hypothetical protein G7Z17_g9197 [Cylindrodendrum hubeiense]